MKQEIESIPITPEHVVTIADAVKNKPSSPLVVPLSYERVTVPGALPECIDGVLKDPSALYLNDRNVPVGPSRFLTDEHGRIYDGRAIGITVQSLLSALREETKSVWTLQLNLADPGMPRKLTEMHRAMPEIGLVALVIPDLASSYMNALKEFEPVLYHPNR